MGENEEPLSSYFNKKSLSKMTADKLVNCIKIVNKKLNQGGEGNKKNKK